MKTTELFSTKIEDVFYDKELSDSVRDIVINSQCEFEPAVRLLKISQNHKRDIDLIKKLYNSGMREGEIFIFIGVIND